MLGNGGKLLEMAVNSCKCLEWLKMAGISCTGLQMDLNSWKWLEKVWYGLKLLEMTGLAGNGNGTAESCWKWLKMAGNSWKYQEMEENSNDNDDGDGGDLTTQQKIPLPPITAP